MVTRNMSIVWRYESAKFIFRMNWPQRGDRVVRAFLRGQMRVIRELRDRVDGKEEEGPCTSTE
jgi:hypothetical protein